MAGEGLAKMVVSGTHICRAADRNAWHVDWDAERSAGVAKKTGDEQWGTLSRVLTSKLGKPVALRHA